VVLTDAPLGARRVDTLTRIEHDLPGLWTQAGLGGVQASLGGDTAIAKVIVDQTRHDLGRIALASLAANLLFLMLFLRARWFRSGFSPVACWRSAPRSV
jgi:RND superfamily putative drug exporter